MLNPSCFDISRYTSDGFRKVCDVRYYKYDKWYYENIDREIMYDSHKSWVYFIVVADKIVKCGETGNPLGIEGMWTYDVDLMESQPITGSKSRFGRLRTQCGDTDEYLRQSILPWYNVGKPVTLWAKKCPLINVKVDILGESKKTVATIHKNLELFYLNSFKHIGGCLPICNKATK